MNRRDSDMTHGPLLGKLILFAIPIILTGMLQLLYNAADMVIVGRYDGKTALAAVGATSSLISLIVNTFMGLSLGSGVIVAQHMGGHRDEDVRQTVHTSIAISLICGVVLLVVGVLLAKPMLTLMDTPTDALDQAVLYMRIYFLGVPAALLFNFGTAILRAVGDSKRPLWFLAISGIFNVLLNIILVKYVHLGVAGVAIATVTSQVISATLTIISLTNADGCYRLNWRYMRIYGDKLSAIIRIGVPAGIQSALFSISNVMIQSALNGFGSIVVAGHTAAVSIEGFMNVTAGGISQSAMTFIGQNTGARKPKRILRIILISTAMSTVVIGAMSVLMYGFGWQLLSIFTDDATVIDYGMIRLKVICTTYLLLAYMDLFGSAQRGMGHSMVPMVVSIAGICGFRILWLKTIFISEPTIMTLYLSYPASWLLTGAVHLICLIFAYHSTKKMMERSEQREKGTLA